MTMNLFSLEGRVAMITGGNGGIGQALALGFLTAGARVAITGRNPEKNQRMTDSMGDNGSVFPLDVRDEAAVQQTIAQVIRRYGRLDILVNNAGNALVGPIVSMSLETWHAVIDTHLTGAFLCSKYAAQVMSQRREGGKIINIASEYAIYGPREGSSYASAKTGLLGLTRALAVELAANNIQVNAILPGWIETEMTQGLAPARREMKRRKTPAGRWGKAEDMVGAGLFLASAASNFVTGVSLPVDGGYAISEHVAET